MTDINCFDDLGKDTPFSYKGTKYFIPAITNEKAEELFQMSKSKKPEVKPEFDSNDLKEKIEESEKEENDPEFMFKYIKFAIEKEDGSEFKKEEYNKWPMKVTLRVMKLINDCVSQIDEDNSVEKK